MNRYFLNAVRRSSFVRWLPSTCAKLA